MKSFIFLITLLSTLSLSAQNDDVYWSPKDEDQSSVDESAPQQTQQSQSYVNEDDNYYDDEQYYSESSTTTDGSGNTYITNNYYGDYYDDDYSTRLDRFYSPYYGFDYYSPCYSGYYYPNYYNSWGWSVSVSWGWGWGGYYDPWYNPYYGGGWYGGYCGYNNYWHGYGHGYNNGYWDGYYDGYYGYPYYGGGYYGGGYNDGGYYGGGYYYGPRRESQGMSSYRNNYAEKTQQSELASGQTVNTMPVAESTGMIKPIRTSSQPSANQTISKNDMKPAGNTVQQPSTTDKGDLQPIDDKKTVPQNQKGDVKPVNQNNANTVNTAPQNGNVDSKTRVEQAPTDKSQVEAKPGTGQQTNNEKAEQPRYQGTYQQPDRGNVQQNNQTAPSRGNTGGNNTQTQQQQPDRGNVQQNNQTAPSRGNTGSNNTQTQQQPDRNSGTQYQKPSREEPVKRIEIQPQRQNQPQQQQQPQRQQQNAPRTYDRGGSQGGTVPQGGRGGTQVRPR